MTIKESIEAIIEFFMKPDMKVLNDISKLLAYNQYERCAMYIKSLNQKTLKDALNYVIKKSKKDLINYWKKNIKKMNVIIKC